LVLVEVVAGAEFDVQFQVARVWFDSYVHRLCAEALTVGSFSGAVQVVQKVDLLLLGSCEVDVVLGGDWVVIFCS
jgi:hypothetical protein